ncbi:hypothetical protein ID875_30625 [Streptomyces globisporus]|uniref:Uncharacterized protein n=1 Tax=Streptomyces globisporus TaxID=1908 RepID=A0A927BPR4_STRGL|nr:hypothetical protein [Streptomyces globisporus]
MRYAVLRRHWNSFNHLLVAERARVLSDGHFDSRAYGELFVEALHEGARGAESIPDDFVAVYRDAANAATGEVRRRLLVRLAGLEEETGAVNAYVAGAIHEFAALSRLWPGIDLCRTTGREDDRAGDVYPLSNPAGRTASERGKTTPNRKEDAMCGIGGIVLKQRSGSTETT